MKSHWIVRAVLALILAPSISLAVDVPIKWLDGNPSGVPTGVSWGVPFTKGQTQKTQTFALTSADGKTLPLQNWPLAYWADGSIKWMGFATVAGPQTTGPLKLTTSAASPGGALKVNETPAAIDIDTGWLQCHISKQGANLFDSMIIGGKTVAQNGQLECILQNGAEQDSANPPAREKFLSNIEKMTVEQTGPVRAVVKIEGKHKSTTGQRAWLPFVVRLYFYTGTDSPVHMVHTMFFDGDLKKDFIRGLGLTFKVPFREEVQNRHVRLGGEGEGLWSEPVQPYLGGPGVGIDGQMYARQIAGQKILNRAEMNDRGRGGLDNYTKWNNFRLIQPNAFGFTIEKQANTESCWLSVNAGKRSNGIAFIGDVSGGLAVGLKDFWQSCPTALEVRNALSDAAEMRVWLWSPDAPAMDLRHYDTVAHPLAFTYEDSEEDLSTSTPYGVARTHELTLFPTDRLPTRKETSTQAQITAKTPLLVCTPQFLHDQGAFGIWPVLDHTTPFKAALTDYVTSIAEYYQKEIDQSNWYGFWDYGDVMHAYDEQRHEWKYDIGGCAWDNSEQGTDMVLWYTFLGTGRPDIFRQAEAMSRITGEVDSYHFGPLAGLGSRHNVRHWGCGAKEARISMAPYRRYYYYLTTDERTGDVMREMLQADHGVTVLDPMRKADPPVPGDEKFPTRIRGGPDWFALAGNWMTEWERTGDTKWRDKIYAGMDSIAAFPFGFSTGRNLLWGFFPETGKLVARDPNRGGYNLTNQMGGPEIIFELNEMIDHPGWQKVWRDYCSNQGGRFAAYMYRLTKDPQTARGPANGLANSARSTLYTNLAPIDPVEVLKPSVEGPTGLVTNNVNQSTLGLLEVMAMCDDLLPKEIPAAAPNAGRGGRGGRGRGAPPATNPAPEAQ